MALDPQRAKSIFLAALEQASKERGAFLDEACAGDLDLRRRVERLLLAHDRPDSLPDAEEIPGPTQDSLPSESCELPPSTASQGVDTVIGPYKLVQEIGEGGMGTVWLAQQTAPVKRLVALKVIKPGMDSKQVLARFEAERQALALMDHPNIAKVFDGGQTLEGRPYFVMELVKGVPITKFCDERRLTPRERLELFVPICQAIQHAHQKGVIHRDIKPSNVLVASYDGKPVPKVIDFGIAKATGQHLTEHTLVTGIGAVVGTLEYMSPEQAELNQLDIDTRSDVYSLGVLLYELLTGTTPLERKRLKEAALLEVLRLIREEEPPRPSTRLSTTEELPSIAANRGLEPRRLSGLVRGELDWIVMKSLDKDRSRRYESAGGFAQDIQHYLADEPVLACPPSAAYRLRKLVRRNKGRLAVAGLILLCIALLGGGGGWVIRDREAREQQAAQERLEQERELDWEVTRLLDEAGGLCEKEKWPEALAVVERADKLLVSARRSERPPRLLQLHKELNMVLRLEEISREPAYDGLLSVAEVGRGKEEDAQLTRTFQEFGIDVDALDVVEAVAAIGRTSIRPALVKGLDDWIQLRSGARAKFDSRGKLVPDPGLIKMREIVRQADHDAWRSRIREAGQASDRHALEKLMDAIPFQDTPPATLSLLASAFFRANAREKGMTVLRRGQRQYPDDLWLNAALAFFSMRDLPPRYDDALRGYAALLALRPHVPRWHRAMARTLEAMGATDAALAEYSRAIELTPKDADARLERGRAYKRAGQLERALADCSRAVELEPGNAFFHLERGTTLHAMGRLDEAIAELRQSVRLRNDAVSRRTLGAALAAKGLWDEAASEYQNAIRLWKKNTIFRSELGGVFQASGQWDRAIVEYREILRMNHDPWPEFAGVVSDSLIHCNLGLCFQAKDQLDKAIAEFVEAIRLQKDFAEAHFYLGMALAARGQGDAGLIELGKAIELNPKLPLAWLNRGAAYLKRGQYDRAIADFSRLIKLDPKNAQGHNDLAWLLATCPDAKFRDPKRAVQLASKAVQLTPNDPRSWGTLSAAHYRAGNDKEAIAALDRLRFLTKGGDAYTFLFLALVHRKRGDFEQARKWYDQAIRWMEKNSQTLAIHPQQGEELRAHKEMDEAIAALRKAVEYAPNDARTYTELGFALRSNKKSEEALACFSKAIELQPNSAVAWNARGGLYCASLNQPDQAVRDFSEAIKLSPNDTGTWLNRGVAYGRLGQHDNAVADFSEVIKRAPQVADAWRRRGIAYCDHLGQAEKAVADFSKVLELVRPNANDLRNRGNAYRRLGQYKKAVADYSAAIDLDRKFVAAWISRSTAYSYLGQYDRAAADAGKAIELAPRDAGAHNNLAWLLATCPDAKFRNPERAVQLASKAVQLAPKEAYIWGTVGTAHYRAGNGKEAIAALDRARSMTAGGDACTLLFLAMAHRKQGDPDQAGKWYDQAVRWMEKNSQTLAKDPQQAEELRRFRTEAEEVLGLRPGR
jgi:tetratricopeptide (TPR) repeat protein/serine/threonine protein kinase